MLLDDTHARTVRSGAHSNKDQDETRKKGRMRKSDRMLKIGWRVGWLQRSGRKSGAWLRARPVTKGWQRRSGRPFPATAHRLNATQVAPTSHSLRNDGWSMRADVMENVILYLDPDFRVANILVFLSTFLKINSWVRYATRLWLCYSGWTSCCPIKFDVSVLARRDGG